MKTYELETPNGDYIRATWNESATFNFQYPVGGQWVDYHCFTVYNVDSEEEALEYITEELLALITPEWDTEND